MKIISPKRLRGIEKYVSLNYQLTSRKAQIKIKIMESFSAKQKMEKFTSVDSKSLAESHGMVVSQSKLVDISKQMKLDAFEASTVDAITKTNGAISVIVYILRDGNGSPVGAFSPQNPNVANAPISAVVASLGI